MMTSSAQLWQYNFFTYEDFVPAPNFKHAVILYKLCSLSSIWCRYNTEIACLKFDCNTQSICLRFQRPTLKMKTFINDENKTIKEEQ